MSETTEVFSSSFDDPTAKQVSEAMAAAGESPTESVPVDYFIPGKEITTMLPDGIQWVTTKQMTEGDRKSYLAKVNRDMKIEKASGDAILKVAAGEDRTALLKVAITGWSIVRNSRPLEFDRRNLDEFLELMPPHILDKIEKDVRKNNLWLLDDMSIEDIDEEIDRLEDLKKDIKAREQGKSDSAD